MPQAYTIDSSDDRHYFHVVGNSSENSLVTLQRAPSLTSSRSKSRGQSTPQSAQSQTYNGDTSESQPTISSDLRRQPSIEGVANLNRWSRSTSSSRETNPTHHSSRRMSSGGSGTFNFGTPEPERPSPKRLQKIRPSTGNSPSHQTQPTRLFEPYSNPVLHPIVTVPNHQTLTNHTSSPLTASPSTAGLLSAAVRSTVPDYFTSWDSTPKDFSQKRVSLVQSGSASIDPSLFSEPITVSNRAKRQEAEEQSVADPSLRGHSRNQSEKGSGGTGSSKNSKQPSQKAMLSKALQKANTAVLLDNAQNFDGAMHAYSEACSLLQQVMLRSSGEEDRRKLEAIVSSRG